MARRSSPMLSYCRLRRLNILRTSSESRICWTSGCAAPEPHTTFSSIIRTREPAETIGIQSTLFRRNTHSSMFIQACSSDLRGGLTRSTFRVTPHPNGEAAVQHHVL
ncbi:hypothetical protein EYF80_002444 [Liparis tanakae]|uniref:Uncharacterized protein n=1 Tax=Liparis tanakae TaxID=230148 RepID=A0A4Z2JD85_9TELE|nr:hypothetical protein EYF80_002444 [Liparis tanakae]